MVIGLCCVGCGARAPGAALLTQGRYQEVLRTVRPVDQQAAWIRACAWWRLGKKADTRKELLVGLSRDRRSATGHRLLGSVEAHMGFRGAALRHLQRSLELEPDQPAVRRAVAWLLLRRALQRVGQGMGPHQKTEAQGDVRGAISLLPPVKPRACAISSYISRHRPKGATRSSSSCPGPPPELARREATPPRQKRCRISSPTRTLEKIRREHLLVSCRGAQEALRLEQHGCLPPAGEIWTALIEEAPADPRWYLMAARNLLVRGKPARARQQLIHHLYLSGDRGAALLDQARVLLGAGYGRRAARRAVEAMAFIKDGPRLAEARELLGRCEVGTEIGR